MTARLNRTCRSFMWAAAMISVSALGGCALFFPKPEPRIAVRTSVNVPPKDHLKPTDTGLIIDVDGFAVDSVPAGKPLTSVASLITGPANEPMPGSSGADRIFLIPAESLPAPATPPTDEVQPLQSVRLLVPTGWTGWFHLTGPAANNPGLAIFIAAPASGSKPVLRVGAHSAADDEELATKAPPKPDEANTLTVEWPLTELPGSFGIGIEAGRVLGSPRSTIWRISVSEAASDSVARDDLRALVDEAIKSAPRPGASPWAGASRSLRTANADVQRGVLTVAALGVNADLCAEVATLAEPAGVAPLASAVAAAWDALPPQADSPAAAWAADRAAAIWLSSLRAKNILSKPLASTLAARFGEVGRDPATVADLASKSATAADFRQRLIAEHIILLDDLAPGTRVRAFDWLSAAGAAPAGFDPLGPARERRAAIDKHLESLAPKSSTP